MVVLLCKGVLAQTISFEEVKPLIQDKLKKNNGFAAQGPAIKQHHESQAQFLWIKDQLVNVETLRAHAQLKFSGHKPLFASHLIESMVQVKGVQVLIVANGKFHLDPYYKTITQGPLTSQGVSMMMSLSAQAPKKINLIDYTMLVEKVKHKKINLNDFHVIIFDEPHHNKNHFLKLNLKKYDRFVIGLASFKDTPEVEEITNFFNPHLKIKNEGAKQVASQEKQITIKQTKNGEQPTFVSQTSKEQNYYSELIKFYDANFGKHEKLNIEKRADLTQHLKVLFKSDATTAEQKEDHYVTLLNLIRLSKIDNMDAFITEAKRLAEKQQHHVQKVAQKEEPWGKGHLNSGPGKLIAWMKTSIDNMVQNNFLRVVRDRFSKKTSWSQNSKARNDKILSLPKNKLNVPMQMNPTLITAPAPVLPLSPKDMAQNVPEVNLTNPFLKTVARTILLWNLVHFPNAATRPQTLITDEKTLEQHLVNVDKEKFMLQLDEALEQSARKGETIRFEQLSGLKNVKQTVVVVNPWLRTELQKSHSTKFSAQPLSNPHRIFKKEAMESFKRRTHRKGK